MAMKNAPHDSTAAPPTDQPSSREQDTCEGIQGNGESATTNNPPNHGLLTHGVSRFLWECPKETPVSELGKRYDDWLDEDDQAEIGGWRQ